VQVCDASDGLKLIRTYSGHHSAVTALAWSPDGQYIASGSADTTVQVWDPMTGKRIMKYSRHSDLITGIAWLPTMNTFPPTPMLVTGSRDGTVHIWDALTGKDWQIDQVEIPRTVSAVSCSPDGKMIATAYNEPSGMPDGSISHHMTIRDAQSGAFMQDFKDHLGEITSIAWSPDNRSIATASEDGKVIVRDINDGNSAAYRQHNGPVRSVAWSPDGSMIASSGDDATTQVWQIDD
jgi:WD40 repeat protein